MTLQRPELWWPAGIAALLGLLWMAELLPGAAPVPPPLPVGRPLPAAADDNGAQTGKWTKAILARPLFRPDRRPAAVAAAMSVDISPPRLSAIVITAAGRSAIFINPDGTSSVLPVGGQTGVYQVQSISADSVRLTGPDGVLTLHPQFNNDTGAAVPNAAAPAAAPQAGRFQEGGS